MLLCARDATAEEPFTIPCESRQKDNALRRHLYGYFAAVKAFADEGLAAIPDTLMLCVEPPKAPGRPCCLVFRKRIQSWEAQAIIAAVEAAVGAPTPPPDPSAVATQQHLERLATIRATRESKN